MCAEAPPRAHGRAAIEQPARPGQAAREESPRSAPEGCLTIVVASWQPLSSLASCLDSLNGAAEECKLEVVVARGVATADEETAFRRVVGRLPCARAVTAPAGAGVPELRATGARAASCPVIAMVEDHCRVPRGWCTAAAALAARWGAVGGPVANISRASLAAWAAYFVDYGEHAPAAGGEPVRLGNPSGANAAYRREALLEALGDFPAEAPPWEGPLHAALARRGIRPRLVRELELGQEREPAFLAAARERFQHGRTHAAERAAQASRRRALLRLGRVLVAPLVPAALLARTARRAWRAGPEARSAFLRACPLTLALFGAWAAGEAAGYLGAVSARGSRIPARAPGAPAAAAPPAPTGG